MLAAIRRPLGAGLAAFFAMLIVASVVLGRLIPTTCGDGWQSPSIGRQGACSWHGGVSDHGKGILSLLLSIAVGVGVARWRVSAEDTERGKGQR